MLIFEYPFKDFLALDRAVGTGELQGVVAWALSYRRFPVVDLAVRTVGPEEYRVELRLFSEPGALAISLPLDTEPWPDLDPDDQQTLEFYARPDALQDISSRWLARGESSNDLEATRAPWDYLAFQYLSTWEKEDEGSVDAERPLESLAPADRAGVRGSFAPRARGADIEVMDAGHTVCLLASSAVEHAAAGRAVFAVEAEDLQGVTHWTVVEVGDEHRLLVLRERRRQGDASGLTAGPLVAWFAPPWIRDARRALEDAEETSQVDCLLGAGFREPIVGGSGTLHVRPPAGRGREVELAALPRAIIERAPAAALRVARGVVQAVQRLADSPQEQPADAPMGFDVGGFAPRRAARVLASASTPGADDQSALRGFRLSGPVRCHGVERLLILEWSAPESAAQDAARLLDDGVGDVRAFLVASTHAADEIAALRSLQGAFALDPPC